MKAKKRFFIVFLIFLTVLMVVILNNTIFWTKTNQQELISKYQIKKEKCEMLKEVARETIQEGVGINLKKIPENGVQYDIHNSDDNKQIIFYYYLEDDPNREYNATITLSNEYKIINEEYSVELESFDEYVKTYKKLDKILSNIYSILLICTIYMVVLVIVVICVTIKTVYRHLKEKNNQDR